MLFVSLTVCELSVNQNIEALFWYRYQGQRFCAAPANISCNYSWELRAEAHVQSDW